MKIFMIEEMIKLFMLKKFKSNPSIFYLHFLKVAIYPDNPGQVSETEILQLNINEISGRNGGCVTTD